jgi:hypothetical protein
METGSPRTPDPVPHRGLAEFRFWHENRFLGSQKARLEDINLAHLKTLANRAIGLSKEQKIEEFRTK